MFGLKQSILNLRRANEVIDQKEVLTKTLCEVDYPYLKAVGLECSEVISGSASYGLISMYLSTFYMIKDKTPSYKQDALLKLINSEEIKNVRTAAFYIGEESIKRKYLSISEKFEEFMQLKILHISVVLSVILVFILVFFLIMLKPLEFSLRQRVLC